MNETQNEFVEQPELPQANDIANEENSWSRARSNFGTIGGAVLLALFIRIILFEAFEIEGPSMEPSLLSGDRVVVAKFLYGVFMPFTNEAATNWGTPNPGDIVIVRSPADNIDIVKRVIGVPGDRVEMVDWEVIRNGESLSLGQAACPEPSQMIHPDFEPLDIDIPRCYREHIDERRWLTSRAPPFRIGGEIDHDPMGNMEERIVPPGHIFVMGDHRDHSNDSRQIGMVPVNRIKGRVLSIYWSNNDRPGAGWWDSIRTHRIFSDVH